MGGKLGSTDFAWSGVIQTHIARDRALASPPSSIVKILRNSLRAVLVVRGVNSTV